MMPPVSPPCGEPYSVKPPDPTLVAPSEDGTTLPVPCCLVYQTLPSGPGLIATGPMLVTLN